MRYIALLRGINVGGNNKVAMPKLKLLFESLGFADVLTYINSGNVIFSTELKKIEVITKTIEVAIKEDFGFAVYVLVISASNLISIADAVPVRWANDQSQKTDVMFLWDEINSAKILNKFKLDPIKERLIYCNGALVWNVGREYISKGSVIKTVTENYYKKMTIRNINTVRKLAALVSKSAEPHA